MGKKIHILSDVNEAERTGVCANCGPVKLRKSGDRLRCAVAKREHKGTWRRSQHHGLTPRQAAEYIAERGGRCEICGTADGPIYVDHDHSTGDLRGALCRKCNLGIAYFKDDPEVLRAAIRYLS